MTRWACASPLANPDSRAHTYIASELGISLTSFSVAQRSIDPSKKTAAAFVVSDKKLTCRREEAVPRRRGKFVRGLYG